MKRLKKAGALLLVLALLCGVGGALLKPEPAPPELLDRARPSFGGPPGALVEREVSASGRLLDLQGQPVPGQTVVARDAAARLREVITDVDGHFTFEGLSPPAYISPEQPSVPSFRGVREDRDDLEFTLAGTCALQVRVLAEGQPVQGAAVEAELLEGAGEAASATTDAEGTAHLELACGDTRFEAFHPDYPAAVLTHDPLSEGLEVSLQLRAGLRLFGRVSEPSGEPVEHCAVLTPGDYAQPDEQGRYTALMEPRRLIPVHLECEAHQSENELVLVPEGALEVEHDIVVQPAHVVEVFCPGLEGDSCADLPLVMCTEPRSPMGSICFEMGGAVTCRCPTGEAAVRGGGTSVLVRPEDDVAWLDLRAPGSVSGRVLVDGEPAPCSIQGTEGIGLGLGGLSVRLASCGPDGRFNLDNLDESIWRFRVQAAGAERTLGPLQVEGDTDLGDVEVFGGSTIEGRVVDEVEGRPVAGVAVAAVAYEGDDPGGVGSGRSDEDGRFVIRGLPPGTYQVFLAASPLERVEVDLVEHAEVELVQPTPADLALEAGEDGRMVVTALGEEAPEGFEEGDVLIAVELFGVDPGEVMPGLGDQLARTLLGATGFPGVTVVIEREGEELEL